MLWGQSCQLKFVQKVFIWASYLHRERDIFSWQLVGFYFEVCYCLLICLFFKKDFYHQNCWPNLYAHICTLHTTLLQPFPSAPPPTCPIHAHLNLSSSFLGCIILSTMHICQRTGKGWKWIAEWDGWQMPVFFHRYTEPMYIFWCFRVPLQF